MTTAPSHAAVLNGRRRATASRRGIVAVMLSMGLAPTVAAQLEQWRAPVKLGFNPAPRSHQAMVYDAVQQRVVMIGGELAASGGPMWAWNGASWVAGPTPPALDSPAVAFDPVRDVLVLVGGAGFYRETWEFRGGLWRRMQREAFVPSAGCALAYDPDRSRVILFGGQGPFGGLSYTNDTLEWVGGRWWPVAVATPPPARRDAALAWDAARRRMVLFGGNFARPAQSTIYLNDTWEWDGTNWTKLFPAFAPSVRDNFSLAYDPGQQTVLLFGGYDYSTSQSLTETWAWNGVSWTMLSPSVSPSARVAAVMATDECRERIVLFGGAAAGSGSAPVDTWEWDGATWAQVPGAGLRRRTETALAYDASRQRTVVFGGRGSGAVAGMGPYLGDTWEFDGETWVERADEALPGPRAGHAMAFDTRRQRTVLFGGHMGSGMVFGDTWEWDGTNWTPAAPGVSPIPRYLHQLVYDTRRGQTLLFGGIGGLSENTVLGDFWSWDGTNWTPLSVGSGPPPRYDHAMAYDAVRDRTVVFGGRSIPIIGTPNADTWEWDGTRWGKMTPLQFPAAGARYGMAYDLARSRILLAGSRGAGTWAWDGRDWNLIAGGSPSGPLAFDVNRSRAFNVEFDTHELVPPDFAVTSAKIGGKLTFLLSSPMHAGLSFKIFWSAGTATGIPLGAHPQLGPTSFNLNADSLFVSSASLPMDGVLDGSGSAVYELLVPDDERLNGFGAFAAAVMFDGSGIRGTTLEDYFRLCR